MGQNTDALVNHMIVQLKALSSYIEIAKELQMQTYVLPSTLKGGTLDSAFDLVQLYD